MASVHRETRGAITNNEGSRVNPHSLYQKDILSMKELSLQQIEQVLTVAGHIKARQFCPQLTNKIIASCFFEPSTRTRLSFESAALRSGGQVIGFVSDDAISIQKGESLQDTIQVVSRYADLVVLRHPNEGSARLAADIATVPVINAGDGSNQHPTQTLTDLFSIQESQGRLTDLSIALVGDLKYGRTVHSFVQVCSQFNIRLYLVAPESLTLSDSVCDDLKRKSVRFSFHQSLEEIIDKVDVIYMTRVQKERMPIAEYQSAVGRLTLTESILRKARSTMKILHPLPRVNEIDIAVDKTPFAYYFEQAANGVFVRQALLSLILNQEEPRI